MEREERIIDTELCVMCGITLGESRNELTATMDHLKKPIYLLIEEFTSTCFSEEIVSDAGICFQCLLKFNEYDECLKSAYEIQQTLAKQFFSTINQVRVKEDEIVMEEEESPPVKQIIEEDFDTKNENPEEGDMMIYQAIDDIATETDEFILTQEITNIPEDVMVSDTIELAKLPRKFQNTGLDEKNLIFKSRSINNTENNTSFSIIHLSDENIVLYQCDICTRTFKEKSKLKMHRAIHTTERNVICPECNKTFKTQACLRSHRRIHARKGSSGMTCDHCGKVYTGQKSELIKHMKISHLNIREFKCDQCPAAFGTKAHMKAHRLTHDDLRPEKCEVCGYAFHTKEKLLRHMKSHTGERDYQCGICNKKFLYSYNVNAHIKLVHFGKKRKKYDRYCFPCSICEAKFSNKISLQMHLQDIHKIEEVENFDEYIEDEGTIIEHVDA